MYIKYIKKAFRNFLMFLVLGGTTMTNNKPDQTKDPIWEQHLRWLDLIGNECRSNQLKREREKRRRKGE